MGNVFIVITIVVEVTQIQRNALAQAAFEGKYNVEFVVDDRPSVCRQWHDMGLKVLRVGNPYIEF